MYKLLSCLSIDVPAIDYTFATDRPNYGPTDLQTDGQTKWRIERAEYLTDALKSV